MNASPTDSCSVALCVQPLCHAQTSHITPQQAGGIFAAAKPRLAVAHHLTVNAASRAAIIQDIRQGYTQVCANGLGHVWELLMMEGGVRQWWQTVAAQSYVVRQHTSYAAVAATECVSVAQSS